jgi:Cu2+-exporting ATPase
MQEKNSSEKIKYVCLMGCVEPQDEPGLCSVCGMRLVKQKIKDSHHNHNLKSGETDKHHGHSASMFLKKFWLSFILTLPVVFYSEIFQKFFGIHFPEFFSENYLILILSSIVFVYGGSVFLISAIKELKARNPGMMTLIALAISSAYLYSVLNFIFGKEHEFFWEITSLITIMLLGHYFEMKSVSSAQGALKEIEKLLPDKAELIDGRVVSLSELKIGDVVLVKPGSKIPVDGIVINGKSEVNESMITGESKPVEKNIGSQTISGTLNGDGVLKIKVTKIGEETFLAGIKKLIQEAQKSKSKLQVLADIFAKYLTYVAIFAGVLSFIIWAAVLKDVGFALERLVTVLIVACPHALGLAVPLVVAISTSLAVRNGFLIKNRLQMELARKVDIVLFDKTGTLTTGKFKIKEIIPLLEKDNLKILQISASLSQYSNHLFSAAILEKAQNEKLNLLNVSDFKNFSGRGISAKINDKIYWLGGENLIKDLKIQSFKINSLGSVSYLIDESKNILGALVLEDEIRPESKKTIDAFKNLKIKTAMLTGDKKDVAQKVASVLGLDEYFAEVLPEEKINKVKELQSRGYKVMMVGDGINDAPALMQADVGVAIGAGTNVAIESAGIILVQNNPLDIIKLIKLSRLTYKKMIQNLFWASGYNIFTIPLAGGILAFKGILLSPALGAVLMSLSTIIVAINALIMKKVKI